MIKILSRLAVLLLLFGLTTISRGADAERLQKLIDELKNGDRGARREAAYQIHQLGKEAKPAVPALIKALGDSEQQVWFHAVMTLAELGPDAAEAIPALLEFLKRGGRGNRDVSQTWYRAAYALGKMGPASFPVLTNALAGDNDRLRAGA